LLAASDTLYSVVRAAPINLRAVTGCIFNNVTKCGNSSNIFHPCPVKMVLILNVRLYRRSPTLRNFKLGLSNLRRTTFHKSKKINNNNFEMGAEFFLVGSTAEGEENDGRILMGYDRRWR